MSKRKRTRIKKEEEDEIKSNDEYNEEGSEEDEDELMMVNSEEDEEDEEDQAFIEKSKSRKQKSKRQKNTTAPPSRKKRRKEEDETDDVSILQRSPTFKSKSKLFTNRKWKNLKQIIASENYSDLPPDIPTYVNIESSISLYPLKKYCDITGLEGRYTDPRTHLRYHSSAVYKHLIAATVTSAPPHSASGTTLLTASSSSGETTYVMSEQTVNDYLSLRRAVVTLK